jgi:predicted nucleic acid-binding protein
MPKTVYWDACIFHALFSNEKTVDACKRVEKAAQEGTVQIYTSAVTFTECVWLKTETDPTGNLQKLSPKHEEVIAGYFQRSYIIIINCDRNIGESSRRLIWQHPALKPKDAIHIASAIAQQLDVLHSFDRDLLKLDGKISGLKICHPDKDGDFPTTQKPVELSFEESAVPPRPPRRIPPPVE